MKGLFFALVIAIMIAGCKPTVKADDSVNDNSSVAHANNDQHIHNAIDSITIAWNTQNLPLFESLTTKGLVRMENGKKAIGSQKEYENFMNLYHTGFPDFEITFKNPTIKGDSAFLYWQITGTNTATFGNIPPTGKKLSVHGFSVWTFDGDGKATKEDAFFDNLIIYQQMGFAPPKK